MSVLRKSACGMTCQVRIPGYCNHDDLTTVLAHVRSPNTGMGMKAHDIHASYTCSGCHDVLDGRVKTKFTRDDLRLMHLDAVLRTQRIMLSHGLIKIK
jgi:hypothetical protein